MDLHLLIKKREEQGYSQQEIAKKLGYRSKGSYSLIENGKTKINIELANKLSNILKLTDEEILQIFFKEIVHKNQT